MKKIKNIYSTNNYKSNYNMILLDECICDDLYYYLKDNLPKRFNKKFTIISVNDEPSMKEMQDKDLADFCYDYNGVLITSDKDFFSKYLGFKIYYEKINRIKVLQKTAKYLKINSSNEKSKD